LPVRARRPSALTGRPPPLLKSRLSWTNNATNQTGCKIERSSGWRHLYAIGTTALLCRPFRITPSCSLDRFSYNHPRACEPRSALNIFERRPTSPSPPRTLLSTDIPTQLDRNGTSSTQIKSHLAAAIDNRRLHWLPDSSLPGRWLLFVCAAELRLRPASRNRIALCDFVPSYPLRALDANKCEYLLEYSHHRDPVVCSPPARHASPHTETSALSEPTAHEFADFLCLRLSRNLIIVSVKWGKPALSVSSVSDTGNFYYAAVGPTNGKCHAEELATVPTPRISWERRADYHHVTLTGNSNSSFHPLSI